LRRLGIEGEDVLVVARPPAREALYHRFENELFDELIVNLLNLCTRDHVKIILLPRSDAQRASFAERNLSNLIMPVRSP
jgi:predicted glycosyltransferase